MISDIDRNTGQYHNELLIYFSINEIDREYTRIASIKISNNAIYGNLIYDKRITNYLIDELNQIDGDALILNESKSDEETTYFDVIIFLEFKDLDENE